MALINLVPPSEEELARRKANSKKAPAKKPVAKKATAKKEK